MLQFTQNVWQSLQRLISLWEFGLISTFAGFFFPSGKCRTDCQSIFFNAFFQWEYESRVPSVISRHLLIDWRGIPYTIKKQESLQKSSKKERRIGKYLLNFFSWKWINDYVIHVSSNNPWIVPKGYIFWEALAKAFLQEECRMMLALIRAYITIPPMKKIGQIWVPFFLIRLQKNKLGNYIRGGTQVS